MIMNSLYEKSIEREKSIKIVHTLVLLCMYSSYITSPFLN
jgi:hypothetical protein